MERKRQTTAGVPIESRIQSGNTSFFKRKDEDIARTKAKELKSYVYDCYEDVERTLEGKKSVTSEHVGYCVPK